MKVVYVTGCLGFIGSYVTRKCLEKGWMVRGVDKVTYAASEGLLKEFNSYSNFVFERKDIKDMDFLYDCDYVINTAAESHVGNSIINSDTFISSNIVGVKNLLDLIRHKPTNCNKRPVFFHFSTDEVYGDIDEGSHKESDILKPSNPYSAAKAAADMLVLAWAITYGVEYILLRPTNNYGIGQYPEKLIPLTVKLLMRGKKIKLHDKGEPIINWLHSADTATAVTTLVEAEVDDGIYNVAGGFEQKNIDTVNKICECYFGEKRDWKPFLDLSYVREGQDVRYALNDDKLRSLGWATHKDFNQEIQHIVEYYKDNFKW